MKYAIISDIHGNFQALSSVLENVKKENPDGYLFLGDYFADYPYPNEVINTIKELENTHIISGNKEQYLVDLQVHDQTKWIHDQFKVMYWNFRELRQDNLEYLLSLPDTKSIRLCGSKKVLLLHSITSLIKGTNLDLLTSPRFSEAMEKKSFEHKEYLNYINQLLSSDKTLQKQLDAIDADIIIFGHTHLQWHTNINGKILINAGSCGLPLDYQTSAPYTILDINDDNIQIKECRSEYDIDKLIEDVKASDLFTYASDWSSLVINEMTHAKEEVAFFFRHANKIAKLHGQDSWPFDNQMWAFAIDSWFKGKQSN
jgi:predicted phosphodiesterase